MKLICRLIFIVATLCLLPLAARAAPTARQCFEVPGITHCIDGRFQEYWNGNGGLPVFGYPITPQRPEVNRDTNQSYQTQWFERNRFEAHPENSAPYDVLLGRLGAELLAQQGRGFEPANDAAPGRCRMFEVGGQRQRVCDPFLAYWESHGLEFDRRNGTSYDESLALFGFPLTNPKMETNPNGDTVLTQWFERARFEDHGTRGVLLGLLGRETLATSPNPPPSETPPPVPPATPTPGPSPQPTPAPPPPSFNNCQADPNAGAAPNVPVRIVEIRKATTPEVVVLRNTGNATVDLTGWRMCSITGNQLHEGIGGALAVGQTREFPYTGRGTIWSNSDRDDGALYNASGQLISYYRDQ